MSKIIFRFSFDKKLYADVIAILESVPKNMRTAFVAEVIRYSMSRVMQIPAEKLIDLNKEKIAEVDNKINDNKDNILVQSEREDSNESTKQQSRKNLFENILGSMSHLAKGE